jgi:hypothetical protein
MRRVCASDVLKRRKQNLLYQIKQIHMGKHHSRIRKNNEKKKRNKKTPEQFTPSTGYVGEYLNGDYR